MKTPHQPVPSIRCRPTANMMLSLSFIHIFILLRHGTHRLSRPAIIIRKPGLRLPIPVRATMSALEILKCAGARRHWGSHAARGARCARELLQLPHVLPLFLGGHFVVDGRVCPFFFFGALFGAFGGVRLFGGGGGDERVDCQDEEASVDGAVKGVS
jgi:hypothetical protein